MMRTIYATGSGTSDAIAYLDILAPFTIQQIQWACRYDYNADNGDFKWQLSQNATGVWTQNDAQGILSTISTMYNILTSGGGPTNLNLVVPMNWYMPAGSRLYLHQVTSATSYANICVLGR